MKNRRYLLVILAAHLIFSGCCPEDRKPREISRLPLLPSIAVTDSQHLGGDCYALAINPQSDQIAVAWNDGRIRFYDPLLRPLPFPEIDAHVGINQIKFSPDGNSLAAAYGDYDPRDSKGVIVWDVSTGKVKFNLLTEKLVETLAYSHRGDLLAIGGGNVHILDSQTGRPMITVQGYSDQLSFSPNDDYLATLSSLFQLKWNEAHILTATKVRDLDGATAAVVISANGQRIYNVDWFVGGVLSCSHPADVRIASFPAYKPIEKWTPKYRREWGDYIHYVGLRPDGNGLIIGDWNGVFVISDHGDVDTVYSTPSGGLNKSCIAPNGQFICGVAGDELCRWDVSFIKTDAATIDTVIKR